MLAKKYAKLNLVHSQEELTIAALIQALVFCTRLRQDNIVVDNIIVNGSFFNIDGLFEDNNETEALKLEASEIATQEILEAVKHIDEETLECEVHSEKINASLKSQRVFWNYYFLHLFSIIEKKVLTSHCFEGGLYEKKLPEAIIFLRKSQRDSAAEIFGEVEFKFTHENYTVYCDGNLFCESAPEKTGAEITSSANQKFEIIDLQTIFNADQFLYCVWKILLRLTCKGPYIPVYFDVRDQLYVLYTVINKLPEIVCDPSSKKIPVLNYVRNNSKIKIFIPFHKQYPFIDSRIFIPVRIGVAANSFKIGDTSITVDKSYKNINHFEHLRELIAYYFVWQSIDVEKSDYIGFFHYRRYLDPCTQQNYTKVESVNEETLRHLGSKAVEDKYLDILRNFDFIVPIPGWKNTPNKLTINEQFAHEDWWPVFIHCLLNRYPKYKSKIHLLTESRNYSYWNVFISNVELTDAYFHELFSVLNDMHLYYFQNSPSGLFPSRLGGIAEPFLSFFIRANNYSEYPIPATLFQ